MQTTTRNTTDSAANFWSGRVVLITGASSGIGRSLALRLAPCGAKIGLIARRRGAMAHIVAEIERDGGCAAFAVADVSDRQAVFDAIASLEGQLGPCDVLIANAGVPVHSPGYAFDAQAATHAININLVGTVNAIAAVLPGMRERRAGHVVGVASIAAMIGFPGAGVYAASKAAMVTLLESLRVDLHPFGVRVTTICPGYVDTPFIADQDPRYHLFKLPVDAACTRIIRAIEKGRPELWFPKRTWLLVRLLRLLPPTLFRIVASRLTRHEAKDQPIE